MSSRRWTIPGIGLALLFASAGLRLIEAEDNDPSGVAHFAISDIEQQKAPGEKSSETVNDPEQVPAQPAAFRQPQPLVVPTPEVQPTVPLPASATQLVNSLYGVRRTSLTQLSAEQPTAALRPAADVVSGREAPLRVTSDAGNLLGKSPSALGLGTQKRTPIVNDPRVRGSRVGRLAAAGSYWVPAREDLDTMMSKIDSRIVDHVLVIPGPYSALYGPDFQFMDVQLQRSPRFENGFELHGMTTLDYQTNGQRLYGRQEVWGGDEVWGFRVGYGHRTGNDYRAGNGTEIPASFNSRDVDVALGAQVTPNSWVEFSYLRLDQTNVEFPGQAFDIDNLKTDGFELEYTVDDQIVFDRLRIDGWYNHTELTGSAQRPGKRRQFPIYDFLQFTGVTDVDSSSRGYRMDLSWGDPALQELVVGTDLRYVDQALNEFTSGRFLFNTWLNANSPIPASYTSNPGFFAEYRQAITERTQVRLGGRSDIVNADVTADPASLAALGTSTPQHSLAQILGTGEFQQNFMLWSAYATGEYQVNDNWTANLGAGYAERPPNLTEMYAAQPFMFLLQNGLNTVTGDPRLAPERLFQLDVGLNMDSGRWRAGARGFYSWVRDYITFENMDVVRGPPTGDVVQTQLKYVNTNLATLFGGEAYVDFDATGWLTPFATIQYVEGTDRTRDGSFATRVASGGLPSVRVPGLPRGFFSGVSGNASEPLPSILPLASRLGIVLHEDAEDPRWTLELAARVVDNQSRVASSLLESTTPGFTVWDLRGSWRPAPRWLLVGGIENFTDKTYREHLDFRSADGLQMFQPGISFYGGAELTY